MTNQSLIVSASVMQSRQPKNGKSNINNQKNYTSLLSEENLKLHIGMMPSAKETKGNIVLGYVDLQKQLVTLESQLRKEAEVAQEKFNSLLPKNTPSVIPEIVNINSILYRMSSTIENEDNNSYTLADNSYKAPPNTIEEIPTLLDSLIKSKKKSQRLILIIKETAKKITSKKDNSSKGDDDDDGGSDADDGGGDGNHKSSNLYQYDKDFQSSHVEPSVLPSPSQSTIRSRMSSPKQKAPLKNIFISVNSRPPHQRNSSCDTTNTFYLQQNSPTSSIHNNPTYTSLQNSPFPPSTPMTYNAPHNSSPLLNSTPSSPNHEKLEIDAYKVVPENRDSGISFVSPGRKSGNHSREHSISSLLRKIGTFHNFNNHSQDEIRKEKSWGDMVTGYKDPNSELLAFRYPSSKDVYNITSDFVGGEENDNSNGDDVVVGVVSSNSENSNNSSGSSSAVVVGTDNENLFTADIDNSTLKIKERSVTFEGLQVTNLEDFYTAPDAVELK